MASIEKAPTGYRVRWRDPGGRQRKRSGFPSREGAQAFLAEVRQAEASGTSWRPSQAATRLSESVPDYQDYISVRRTPESVEQAIGAILRYLDWLGQDWPDSLTEESILRYRRFLMTKDRPCGALYANDQAKHAFRWWIWLYDRREGFGRPPRFLDLPVAAPALRPAAPSWAEMDKAIANATTDWWRDLMVVLRCTGLRSRQAMHLRWEDFDLDRGTLHIRPELGKSRQERRGRVVPIAPVLVDELSRIPRGAVYVIDKRRTRQCGPAANDSRRAWDNMPRSIWERTDVDPMVYRQPLHCFRKGFNTMLAASGVSETLRKYLLGHAQGTNADIYTAWAYLEPQLRAALQAVPPIGSMLNVQSFIPTTGIAAAGGGAQLVPAVCPADS